jgi:ClpP class serine protease
MILPDRPGAFFYPKNTMTKAFNAALDRPWAITEAGLRMVLTVANREGLDIEAVETQLGRKLANTQSVTERDGVAVLPINGPIARHANLFSAISGATSIDLLARDFTAALNNSSIRAILLHMDTPGGEVNGVAEFADMVYAARGKKPIYAYVGGLCASAGYWIGSAADVIICDQTAMLGSIGVIAAVPDPAYDSAGDVVFVSSQSPKKRPDPTTAEGKTDIQSTIDSLAQIFVETVARNRGVTADTVLESFGQGGVFVGKDAIAAGLADRLGSYEDVLAQLAGRQQAAAQRLAAAQGEADIAAGVLKQAIERTDEASRAAIRLQAETARLLSLSAPPASRPARVDIQTTIKENTRMSDEIIQDGAEAPALPPITPPTFNAADPAVTAQVNAVVAQMTAQFEQQRTIVLEQAQAQFQRQMAEMQAQQQIQTYAQHATTATLQRQHALPIEADALTSFLSSLNAGQRTSHRGCSLASLTPVWFPSRKSAARATAHPSRQQKSSLTRRYLPRSAGGMSMLSAIQAVGKEQPSLYAAYQSESSRRGAVAMPAKKGVK